MIVKCRGCYNEKRLKIACLTTLETRGVCADLIEIDKILHGQDKVNEEQILRELLRPMKGGSVAM